MSAEKATRTGPDVCVGYVSRIALLAFLTAVAGPQATAAGLVEVSASAGGAVAWAPWSPKIVFASPVAAVGIDLGWHMAGVAIGVDSAPLIKGEVTCLYDTLDDPGQYEDYDTACDYGRHGPLLGGPGNDHFLQLTFGPMFGGLRVRAGPFVATGPHWGEVGLRSTVVLKSAGTRSFTLEARMAHIHEMGTEAMLLARWAWNLAPHREER